MRIPTAKHSEVLAVIAMHNKHVVFTHMHGMFVFCIFSSNKKQVTI